MAQTRRSRPTRPPTPTPPTPAPQSYFTRAVDWIDRNPFVKLLILFGGIAGALAFFTPIIPSSWFGEKQATQSPASQSNSPVPPPATKPRGLIATTLSDGKTVTISPSYEIRVMPEDAPLLYKELKDMDNAQVILAAAVKRNVLRNIAGFNLEEILVFRPDFEDKILKALQAEMKPRGLTVLTFSLGEIETR